MTARLQAWIVREEVRIDRRFMALAIFSRRDRQGLATVRLLPTPRYGDEALESTDDVIIAFDDCRVTSLLAAELRSGRKFHLTAPLREQLCALCDCAMPDVLKVTYREAKVAEIICCLADAACSGRLVEIGAACGLNRADSRSIIKAKAIIDEHWANDWTLDAIARAVGINRTKLSEGFRRMFGQSVMDCLFDRRLSEAGVKLRSTDLQIAVIGVQAGYRAPASFTRAFQRRFGATPRAYRNHSTGARAGGPTPALPAQG